MRCTVRQDKGKKSAGVKPALVGLPDIGVLLRDRVIAQAAASCGDRLLDQVNRGR